MNHLTNRIHRVNGYDTDSSYTYCPVVIVGAGFAGIAMAYRLQVDLKFDQYRVYDKQAGVGGTWWVNRYPGVACDVPTVFYSYSFAQNPNWSTVYSPGKEIYEYLQDVCNKNGITDKVHLNTDVRTCRWLESEEVWEVQLGHMKPGMGKLSSKERAQRIKEQGDDESIWVRTEVVRCKILVSAVGGIAEPKARPENVPGFEKFSGDCVHSARWDHKIDCDGKNVVVVGTGSSSTQLVPSLLKEPHNAKTVTQIMRSPPWVLEKPTPPGGFEKWEKWAPWTFRTIPGALRFARLLTATLSEWDWRLYPNGEWHETERQKVQISEIRRMKQLASKRYHEILTPDHANGCKRRVYDMEWLPCLNDPRMNLTTLRLSEIRERSVVLGPEQTYPRGVASTRPKEIPADIIVLANGFDMTRWLASLEVRGKCGQDLVEAMQERGGPQAYLGTAFDGFPNFFIICGPNTITGHSSVIMAIENMVNYATNFIRPILRGDVRTVDVKKQAEVAWAQDIQAQLKNTVFATGNCNSWYVDDRTGWNSTVLPYSQLRFWYWCKYPRWQDWNVAYTHKGKLKLTLWRLIKCVGIVFLLTYWYGIRSGGLSLRQYFQQLTSYIFQAEG